MAKIKGIKVTLYEETVTGQLPTGERVVKSVPVEVENVLVGEPTTDDITSSIDLYGKTVRYMLGIPKGNTNDWMDKVVEWTDVYGLHRVKTFGFPITGIEENIPLEWHMKVRCEAYE